MTMTYRTAVVHLPPTPMGLLGERWTIEHWCSRCHQRVIPDQLIVHAQGHERVGHAGDDESFQSSETSGTLMVGQGGSAEDTTSTTGIPKTEINTDHRRR